MFRPSVGVIIRHIENYKFLKIREMYFCLMGSHSYFMTMFSANTYLCNFHVSLIYISTTLNVNQMEIH
jgi:hypothetical protein